MSAHCRPQLDFQFNQNGVRIIWTIFLHLKPLNCKLMLPHKSYSLTPNITSYNVLITNFLEVSGTFLEKKYKFGLEKTKRTELKTVVSLTDTKRPKPGRGRGAWEENFSPSPSSVLNFQRVAKIVSLVAFKPL